LKSFKEYLYSYRTVGIFHEHFTNRLLEDVVRSANPKWAKVRTTFNTRGGISTTVEAEYSGN
ncbi:MAG: NADPH-dependent 7-cyano-7-deazaguanine reductase QueF, partial [Candidatus Omnitrophica bacterium]|nr:NADPH-dependent 7-cyano-7-deazaguanine reductase QueF [Candidatus Omnitrophota bacterium]